jgi:hypothetical protein
VTQQAGIDQAAVARFMAGVPQTATADQIRQVLVRMTAALQSNATSGMKLPGGVSRETLGAVIDQLRERLS